MDTMILEVFTTDDLLAVEHHLKNLSQVASLEETINKVCDCSFLYFYRDLFPDFLRSAGSNTQLLLSAFSDSERILKHVRHLERESVSGTTPCLNSYRHFILGVMKEEFITPICELIETDLRYVKWYTIGEQLHVCSIV